jgi:hypothetical protein
MANSFLAELDLVYSLLSAGEQKIVYSETGFEMPTPLEY